MSIDKFVADPEGYTKGHVVQFSHSAFPPAQAGMQITNVMNHWSGNWTAEEYQMMPGLFTKFRFQEAGINLDGSSANMRIGTGDKAFHTVQLETATIDLGIRYLPWKPDTVTYMQIDGGARTFFTGPLSGCSIFVGLLAGVYWVFHSNRNNAGAHNAGLKASMTMDVITRLPTPVPIVHEAIYQRDYNDFGFVCGRIVGGNWTFYVADTSALGSGKGATTIRRLA